MNDLQRSSMIDRIQEEYDLEKTIGDNQGPDVRAILLVAEALVEIDRSIQVFVDEFEKDKDQE